MSKKNDRRATEREARKLAFQQLRQERAQSAIVSPVADTNIITEIEMMPIEQPPTDLLARAQAFFNTAPEISEAQLVANRANAQLSCGPKSIGGKAKSSQNALKHGLTSQTVVLAGEDKVEYNHRLECSIELYKPIGQEEHNLVQSMLDSHWRISRLLRMESAVLLKGELEFANKFEDQPEAQREMLILAEIYLKYEKPLRNLNIQEARLRRCREKDQAELLRLQTIRKREDRMAAEAEQAPVHSPQSLPSTTMPPKNGFDFSTGATSPHTPFSKAA